MKSHFNIFLLVIVLPLLAFTSIHKYYISVTQVNYVEEKKAVQITSRIFIDDFEKLLKERYDDNLILGDDNELKSVNLYMERYLKEKIKFKINGKEMNISFIGKEYDGDIMRCYLEITGVKTIQSIEIINKVLFDLYDEQKNLVKFKINSKQKSYMLTSQNDKALLNFI